jgi:hypothetical protein
MVSLSASVAEEPSKNIGESRNYYDYFIKNVYILLGFKSIHEYDR